MNKRIFNTFFIISLLLTLAYYINNARIQNNNFFKVNNNIEQIILFNKDFNLYLKNSFKYNNFDIIQNKITSIKKEFKKIQENETLINETVLNQEINQLGISLTKKLEIIHRVKSYRAILNKSYVIAQRIKKDGTSDTLNSLYTTIMTLDKNPEVNIQIELEKLQEYTYLNKNKSDRFFLKHSNAILTYKNKLDQISLKLQQIPIENELNNFHERYNNYSQTIIQKAYLSIIILFILLFLSVIFYLNYDYKLARSQVELGRFRKTVEDSDNIIIITDIIINCNSIYCFNIFKIVIRNINFFLI